jgi:hypothetical protein
LQKLADVKRRVTGELAKVSGLAISGKKWQGKNLAD